MEIIFKRTYTPGISSNLIFKSLLPQFNAVNGSATIKLKGIVLGKRIEVIGLAKIMMHGPVININDSGADGNAKIRGIKGFRIFGGSANSGVMFGSAIIPFFGPSWVEKGYCRISSNIRLHGFTLVEGGLSRLKARIKFNCFSMQEAGVCQASAKVIFKKINFVEAAGTGRMRAKFNLNGLSMGYDLAVPLGPNQYAQTILSESDVVLSGLESIIGKFRKISIKSSSPVYNGNRRFSEISVKYESRRRTSTCLSSSLFAVRTINEKLILTARQRPSAWNEKFFFISPTQENLPSQSIFQVLFLPKKFNQFELLSFHAEQANAALKLTLSNGRKLSAYCLFPLRAGHWLIPGATPRQPPDSPIEAYIGKNALIFGFKEWGGPLIFNRRLFWGFAVPIQRSYRVLNSFQVFRLRDGLELPSVGGSISTDIESWAWTLSCELASAAAAGLVFPDSSGPVEVYAIVNGHRFDFVLDDPADTESFGENSGRITGRSLSAYLDEGFGDVFAPTQTFENADIRTAQQLAVATLPDPNNIPLAWNIEDWLVPAKIWSFRGTTLKALLRIAEAGGAVLSSTQTGVGVAFSPRYAVLPWHWPDATPYASIPRRYFIRRSRRWFAKPRYDVVYIAGEVHPLLGKVQRDGYAGNRPAETIIDRLATAAAAIRQRGERILGDTGLQTLETIAIPLGQELGIVPLGTLVEVEDLITWRGVVRSVSLQATMAQDALEIEQILEIERHHG